MLLLLRRYLLPRTVELLWIPVLFFFYVVMMHDSDYSTKSERMLQHNHRVFRIDKLHFDEYEDENNNYVMDNPIVKMNSNYPNIVWWTQEGSKYTIDCSNDKKCNVFYKKCDFEDVGAYLFYALHLNYLQLPLPRQPNKIIWGVWHEESPKYAPVLLHEKVLSLFNFSSTYSRYSDVPFPLQYLESLESITDRTHYVDTATKNSFLREISPVLYLQSNCDDATDRDAYVDKLMDYIRIDCYGFCRQNKRLPSDLSDDYLKKLYSAKFSRFIARYKFVIAIENIVCEDYVTEKLWRPIQVGSVPIYFGSPSIRDWLPNNKSAILIEDFPTPKLMSEHIKKLLQNDDLYEEYLEHKTKGLITNMRLLDKAAKQPLQIGYHFKSARESVFECFICDKLYTQKNISGNEETHIVNKSHLNCPMPISALTLTPNNSSRWWNMWTRLDIFANNIYKTVLTGNAQHIFDMP